MRISGRDEGRYYRPACLGNDWVAIRLDLPGTDWDGIGQRLQSSWRLAAPRRLTSLLDAADAF